jgi:hypothetical protein
MAVYRAQIQFPADSALPRDIITINPHYEGNDPAGLAAALKANMIAVTEVGATHAFTIKIYDAQKAPPSFPLATASQAGTNFTSPAPRELALCLSYYATWNRPRFRGRLYIPGFLVGAAGASLRPTGTMITKALAWGTTLGKNLPSGHWWAVYSKMDDSAKQVNNIWVDDEWDVQRSRGMRGTTRQTGTIP